MSMSNNVLISRGLTRLVSVNSKSVTVNQGFSVENDPQIERIKREAMREAKRMLEQELAADRKRQAHLWAELEKEFNSFIGNAERKIKEQLVDLSVRIAEVIIRRELPDKAMVCDVIRDTLEPMSDFQGAKVRLNQEDLKWLEDAREEAGMKNINDKIEVVADASLAPGDVLVETKNGYFDGRIEERLKLVHQNLMERCKDNDAN